LGRQLRVVARVNYPATMIRSDVTLGFGPSQTSEWMLR
jgi:hypothetical protein